MKPEVLKKLLLTKKDIVVLDVREADEFAESGTVARAKNMPMGRVFVEAQKGTLPKDRKIVTVCKTGGRCEIVARELRQKGYDIEHLEGGIEAWKKAGEGDDVGHLTDREGDSCTKMIKCAACRHAHNHRGCTDCACRQCPRCGHEHHAQKARRNRRS